MRLEAGAIRELHWHKTDEVCLQAGRFTPPFTEQMLYSGRSFSPYVRICLPSLLLVLTSLKLG